MLGRAANAKRGGRQRCRNLHSARRAYFCTVTAKTVAEKIYLAVIGTVGRIGSPRGVCQFASCISGRLCPAIILGIPACFFP